MAGSVVALQKYALNVPVCVWMRPIVEKLMSWGEITQMYLLGNHRMVAQYFRMLISVMARWLQVAWVPSPQESDQVFPLYSAVDFQIQYWFMVRVQEASEFAERKQLSNRVAQLYLEERERVFHIVD